MVIYAMLRVESVKTHLKQIQVEVGRCKGSDTFIYCITYVRIYNRKRYTRWASTSQVIYLRVIAPIIKVIFHPSYPIIEAPCHSIYIGSASAPGHRGGPPCITSCWYFQFFGFIFLWPRKSLEKFMTSKNHWCWPVKFILMLKNLGILIIPHSLAGSSCCVHVFSLCLLTKSISHFCCYL